MEPSAYITSDSSLFYLGLTIVVWANCILAEKIKTYGKVFMVLNVIVLTFVAGFRSYYVGTDTLSYARFFLHPEWSVVSEKDPLFAALCSSVMSVYPNPTILFVFFAFVIYGLISIRLWEIKDEFSYVYAFMTFYCIYFFETMNILRQWIAVAVIFWGTRFIFKKSYIKYIISVVIAMTIHFSAIIGMIAFGAELLDWKNLSKSKRIIFGFAVFGGIIGLYLVFIYNMFDRFVHYTAFSTNEFSGRMLFVLFILFISIVFYKPNRFRTENEIVSHIRKSSMLYLIFACALGMLSYYGRFAGRLSYYFAPFYGVYFGLIINEKRQINRWILKIPILFLLVYSLINYIFYINGSFHHPYYFIWEM